MKKLHKELRDISFYSPIKKAILKEPDIQELYGSNLDKILSLLLRSVSLKKAEQDRRNEIFLNFKSDN